MRHQPRLPYSGLTIVLSNPSRNDKTELLTGIAGHYFQTQCLGETLSRHACDIRTSDTIGSGLIPGTRGLLLLGDRAFREWSSSDYKDYSINEQRGCPLLSKFTDVPAIASYFPQDSLDIIDHESRLNPQERNANGPNDEDDSSEEDEDDEGSAKKKGRTKRSNYRFWLKQDTRKIIKGIRSEFHEYRSALLSYEIKLGCSSEEYLNFLRSIQPNENLYVDIETTVDGGYNMLCVGVSTETSPVYVIPIFNYNHNLFYSRDATARLLREIALAMDRCVTVMHNGYAFDLLVLAWRYGIGIGKQNYDTMIAGHRCFPEVEKSLGHMQSLWTWLPYHKDEGCFHPHSMDDQMRLWKYNAKDIHGMRIIKQSIDKYAKTIPGLAESITQGNSCVYPYTLASLSGIHYEEETLKSIIANNDRLMTQYLRWINLIKGKQYKERLLPTSSQSCVKFFHDYLNYAVVSRSRQISKKTGRPMNTPSLNEKALYKLKLKYPENILIDICIAYRRIKKETGMLGFEPWDMKALPC
jgi:hypothetical protein